MSPLTTDIRVEVTPAPGVEFPGFHVIAVRVRRNGALSSLDKLIIKPFVQPSNAMHKTIETLRHEANDHATGVAEIFGVLDVRLAGPLDPTDLAAQEDHHA